MIEEDLDMMDEADQIQQLSPEDLILDEKPMQCNTELSSYDRLVLSLVDDKAKGGSKIDPYWKQPLLQLSRPSARELVEQLDPLQCPMGYDPKSSPTTPGLCGTQQCPLHSFPGPDRHAQYPRLQGHGPRWPRNLG